jgi:hypothetical protein
VREVDFGRAAELLAVGHLRLADVGLNLELALQAVDEDVEVKLAHAFHDRLARLVIGLDAEGRVFGSETLQTNRHLFLVSLGLGLDGNLDHRIREGHGFEHDRLVRITQRVTRGRFLQAGERDDVACIGFRDLVAACWSASSSSGQRARACPWSSS